MAAKTRTRIVGSKTEWLGFGGINHFKNIDPHAVSNYFHFVDQTNIHGTMDVFKQLCHFSGFSRTDRYNLVNRLFVQGSTGFKTCRSMTADHFGDGTSFKIRVTWIFTFW